MNSSVSSSTVHQKDSESSEPTLNNLTPHQKKAFSLIVGLLNEAGEEWLPVSSLTSELYPGKEAKKIRNSVSNTLKPLLNKKLIQRKRQGNYVFLRLTKEGYKTSKNLLSKNQLKNLTKIYEK